MKMVFNTLPIMYSRSSEVMAWDPATIVVQVCQKDRRRIDMLALNELKFCMSGLAEGSNVFVKKHAATI